MPAKKKHVSKAVESKARIEASRTSEKAVDLSPDETRLMLHELQVHQIELEMQNDELRRTQTELQAARARYFDLYDLAPVGYCTLSEKGLILQSNLAAATLLGLARGELIKQLFTRFIIKEDQDIYYLRRKLILESDESQTCELRMLKSNGTQFWVHLAIATAQQGDHAPVLLIAMMLCNRT